MSYFIDTNILIDMINKKEEAIEKIKSLLVKDSKLYITKLVILETLRTIRIKDKKVYEKAKEALESFEKLDITLDIYNETIEFSRYFKTEKHKSLKGKCEAIDLLNFIVAKHYGLEIVTNDSDFEMLKDTFKEYKGVI